MTPFRRPDHPPEAPRARLPRGFSIPRGLRRIGGRVYLNGTRIYASDDLEIELEGGAWERGHYWRGGDGAPWDAFVSAVRWISYIVGPGTVIRRAGR